MTKLLISIIMIMIDNDECNTDEHNCDENADCINTVGSFECMCKQTYFGDGVTCLREELI